MTEDEAKTKWCPHARASNAYAELGTSVNRGSKGDADKDCLCLGSICMAWRWLLTPEEAKENNDNELLEDTEAGYCGLAGKP